MHLGIPTLCLGFRLLRCSNSTLIVDAVPRNRLIRTKIATRNKYLSWIWLTGGVHSLIVRRKADYRRVESKFSPKRCFVWTFSSTILPFSNRQIYSMLDSMPGCSRRSGKKIVNELNLQKHCFTWRFAIATCRRHVIVYQYLWGSIQSIISCHSLKLKWFNGKHVH